MEKPVLYIVVPCYNETEVLAETVARLIKKLERLIENGRICESSRLLFVDDGSTDGTWSMIESYCSEHAFVTGISLSRNQGHQNALLAGLMTAKDYGDIVISMDADLQDDINAIDQFIDGYEAGAEIVYGVRSTRKKDSFFKKQTALLFYRLMNRMGVDIIYNHADYRLMTGRALKELEKFSEVNLFLRGIIPLLGFKTAVVEYERNERFAGESKYPLKKMVSFALDGITSFSVQPIRLITMSGFIVSFFSILFLLYVIIGTFLGNTVQGWPTVIVLICFFGGFQILCIGVVGEYVGKIYNETKSRPRYIIADKILK